MKFHQGRMRNNIQEIYNTTSRIDDFVDFSLFFGVNPINFDEAIQDEK